jgi:DNA-directed RNA polymerase specialized sigma24 family protein
VADVGTHAGGGTAEGAPSQKKPTFDALLTHEEVIATFVYILRRGRIPTQELKDEVANVQLQILHSLRNVPWFLWPDTLPAMKALARKAAKTRIIDRWRKNKRDLEAGNLGSIIEDVDEHAAPSRHPSERDPIDQQTELRLLAEVAAASDKPDVTRRLIEGLYEGKGQKEIAEELSLSPREVRDRVAKIRRSFNRKVSAAFGGVGALSVGLFLGMRARFRVAMLSSPAIHLRTPRKFGRKPSPSASVRSGSRACASSTRPPS